MTTTKLKVIGERLRTDFQLSIITLLGAAAIFGIVPFAFYRFLEHNYLAGVTDSIISFGIVSGVAYAWFSGDTERTGFAMAIFSCMAAVVISNLLENVGHMWVYPVLVATFFLTRPRAAILLNTATIVSSVIYATSLQTTESLFAFFTTCIVVSACAFIFALRNEHQREEMANLARLDPLTGARNRRSMDDALKLAVSTAERVGTAYALVILDLDYFKRINDKHGHSLGDDILVYLTKLVDDSTRQTDQLFRFGGEEFVLLMPGVDLQGMKEVVYNLRQKIRYKLCSPDGPVTASFGAALLHEDEGWESWLKRADDALYRAKDAGRDCIIIDDDEE